MSANLSALLYLVASICFIMALRGLSSPVSARNGNFYGIAGMVIAIVTTLASPQIADTVRVLYGGSVSAKNIGGIVAQEDVDGALVGGASLDGEQFATLSAIAAGGPLP